jgi:hypothetical protein
MARSNIFLNLENQFYNFDVGFDALPLSGSSQFENAQPTVNLSLSNRVVYLVS